MDQFKDNFVEQVAYFDTQFEDFFHDLSLNSYSPAHARVLNTDDYLEYVQRFNQMEEKWQALLAKTGLMIESSPQEEYLAGRGRISLNISDRSLFVSFLASLPSPDAGLTERMQCRLIDIFGSLSSQIRWVYDFARADEHFLELLPVLPEIASQQHRLLGELGNDVFEGVLKYERQGCLREYIALLQKGIFSIRAMGLDTSMAFSTPEEYKKRWKENYFEPVNSLRDNPKAQGLLKDALVYATEVIKSAYEYVDEYPTSNEEHRSNMRIMVTEAEQELLKFQETFSHGS